MTTINTRRSASEAAIVTVTEEFDVVPFEDAPVASQQAAAPKAAKENTVNTQYKPFRFNAAPVKATRAIDEFANEGVSIYGDNVMQTVTSDSELFPLTEGEIEYYVNPEEPRDGKLAFAPHTMYFFGNLEVLTAENIAYVGLSDRKTPKLPKAWAAYSPQLKADLLSERYTLEQMLAENAERAEYATKAVPFAIDAAAKLAKAGYTIVITNFNEGNVAILRAAWREGGSVAIFTNRALSVVASEVRAMTKRFETGRLLIISMVESETTWNLGNGNRRNAVIKAIANLAVIADATTGANESEVTAIAAMMLAEGGKAVEVRNNPNAEGSAWLVNAAVGHTSARFIDSFEIEVPVAEEDEVAAPIAEEEAPIASSKDEDDESFI